MDWFFPGKIGSPETIGILSDGWGFPVSIFPGNPIHFRYVVFIKKYISVLSKNAPPSPLLRHLPRLCTDESGATSSLHAAVAFTKGPIQWMRTDVGNPGFC